MAVSTLHAAPGPQNAQQERRPGPITEGLLKWKPDVVGPFAWAGPTGPEAASGVLLRAHALTACLSAGFSEEGGELNATADSLKGLALEGIGDLILLAKLLVDGE